MHLQNTFISYHVVLSYLITNHKCDDDQLQQRQNAFQPNSVHVNSVNGGPGTFSSNNLLARAEHAEDIPIIVWWTGRLLTDSGRGDESSLRNANCPRSRCYNTANRAYLNDSRTRALYFYGSDIDADDLPFPRAAQHEWALFHEESPFNNYMLSHGAMIHLFNHTSTFRRESNYPVTSQSILSMAFLTERQPLPVVEKNKRKLKMRLAPILYVQSHCGVASDRDRYVQELMKHIKIDSYGKCLNNKKMHHSINNMLSFMSDTFYDFIADYKFHLAFENAICNDYMTEKLFRPLHVGSVPIYQGSPLARDWMPDNSSAIFVDQFSSPKALAEFIKRLDENDAEYDRYLEYKKPGGVTNTFLSDHMKTRQWGLNDFHKPNMIEGFECYVCDRISERYTAVKEHPGIELPLPQFADISHLGCAQPYTSLGRPEDIHDKEDGWLSKRWIIDYQTSLYRAEAVQQMTERLENDPSTFNSYFVNISREHTGV